MSAGSVSPDDGEADERAINPSDSEVQRRAEVAMIELFADRIGIPLESRTVHIDGVVVQVDGASADLSVVVECSAQVGVPKPAQLKKVLTDALKLGLLAAHHAPASQRQVLLFADNAAARPHLPDARSWGAKAIKAAGIEVAIVELAPEFLAEIRTARSRQATGNRSAQGDASAASP